MADTILEDIEELAGSIGQEAAFKFAAKFYMYGVNSAPYRREVAEAIARQTAERGSVDHWPSGRIKTAGCGNG